MSGGCTFASELRARIIFAEHRLATDQLFAEVQVVSCRNVLGHFERSLQNRALTPFADALPPVGFLGLGRADTPRYSNADACYTAKPDAPGWFLRTQRGPS